MLRENGNYYYRDKLVETPEQWREMEEYMEYHEREQDKIIAKIREIEQYEGKTMLTTRQMSRVIDVGLIVVMSIAIIVFFIHNFA